MFIIGGIQKTSLIDFPTKVAAVVFTQGCNFRCGYCHNPALLPFNKENPAISCDEFFNFLKTRKGKLDGVVISGGEPTMQSGLYDFILQIKQMGFDVKLDTNGTNPEIVEKLFSDNLLDYVAMDIKAPTDKYDLITCAKVNLSDITKSIELIMNSGVEYEFRTTVLKPQLSFDDFDKIGQMIKGARRYYLQKFVASNIYDESLQSVQTYADSEFESICYKLKKFISVVEYR